MVRKTFVACIAIALTFSSLVIVLASETHPVEEIVAPKYDTAPRIVRGRAIASLDGKYGFINAEGEIVIPLIYEAVHTQSSYNQFAAAKQNGKYGYIDKEGEVVIPFKYDAASPFAEGLAPVQLDGKYGFIDTFGNEVIPFIYEIASTFNSGLAKVWLEGNKQGFIDRSGEVIIPIEYDATSRFSEGLIAVAKREGFRMQWGYLDATGQEIIPQRYMAATDFRGGVAAVSSEGKFGLIDSQGTEILPPTYLSANHLNSTETGLIIVAQGNDIRSAKWGVISTDGDIIVPPIYDSIQASPYFSAPGLITVAKGLANEARWGYIDTSGTEVIPLQYLEAGNFSDGVAWVKQDGSGDKWLLIDTDGATVFEADYEEVQDFYEGVAAVQSNGKWGLVALRSGVDNSTSDKEDLPANILEAETEELAITIAIGSLEVKRGEEILPEPPVAPRIINGRTMLPFRYLVQTVFGGEVEYDDALKRISAQIYGQELRLYVDVPVVEIGDKMFRLDQSPLIINEYTLVPLRAFERLITAFTWDALTQTVTFIPSASAIAEFEQLSWSDQERGRIYTSTLPNIGGAIVHVEGLQLVYDEIYSSGYRMNADTPEEYAHRFLQTLCSGDSAAALFLAPADRKAYDFIENTVFSGYEIVATANDGLAFGLVVKLIVTDSDNKVFPIGESLWDLTIFRNESTDINLFAPHIESDQAVRYGNRSDPREQYTFCANFSKAFGIYDTCYDFAAAFTPFLNIGNHLHYLFHFYDLALQQNSEIYLVGQPWYEAGGMSALKAFLDNLTGTSGIDYSAYFANSAYGYSPERDSTEMSHSCAHGGSWLYWQPVSTTFDEANGVHTTVLNYYSDAAYFLVARTVQYTFRVNTDGTYTMLSTDVLYDSGNPLMYGNI